MDRAEQLNARPARDVAGELRRYEQIVLDLEAELLHQSNARLGAEMRYARLKDAISRLKSGQ